MVKTLNPQMVGISLPFAETLALAMRHGFSGMEVNVAALYKERDRLYASAIRRLLANHELTVEAGSGIGPGRLNATDQEWAAGIDGMEALASFAADIGVKRTAVIALPFHDTLCFSDYFKLSVDRLRQVADSLDRYGIRIAVEYVSQQTRRAASKHPFLYSLDGLLALLHVLDRSNVGILLDSHHWHCAGESRLDLEALRPDQIVTVHLADSPAKPLAEQTATVRELPGDGAADLKGFLAALRGVDYRGPVICEPFHKPFEGMDPEAVAARVSRSIDSVWP